MKQTNKSERLAYTLRFYWPFVLGGALLLMVIAGLTVNWLRQEPEPDYSIAWMTSETPTEEELSQVRTAVEAVADDRNGDGRVLVQVKIFGYAAEKAEPDGASLGEAYQSVAETVWFSVEYQEGTCVLYFLTPETREALEAQVSTLFRPVSACVDGVETDTVPLHSVLPLGSRWDDYVLAVRNLQDQPDLYEANLILLQRLLAASSSQ